MRWTGGPPHGINKRGAFDKSRPSGNAAHGPSHQPSKDRIAVGHNSEQMLMVVSP